MQVEFSPTALRNIQNLPEKIAMACVEFIYGPLAENPRRVGKPLRGELTGQFSARRGTYRIVYEISDDVTDEPDATSAPAADARDDDTGVLRITRIDQIHKIHTFDHTSVVYVKAGNNSFCMHK